MANIYLCVLFMTFNHLHLLSHLYLKNNLIDIIDILVFKIRIERWKIVHDYRLENRRIQTPTQIFIARNSTL